MKKFLKIYWKLVFILVFFTVHTVIQMNTEVVLHKDVDYKGKEMPDDLIEDSQQY
tara:strand:+ start:1436 stop:1600 length:165 start_codon:yes stop_codon:yes gene_type:complete